MGRGLASLVVCGAALASAPGCTYTADVRNTTNEPVFVQMLQIDPIQPDWVLASARIAPGDYAKLGPKRVAFERVVVDVGNQKKQSVNGRMRIRTGTTKLDVSSKPSEEAGREETVFLLEKRDE